MMNTLADLLSSRVKAELLHLLFVTVDQELHVRELARRAGLADATVRQELQRLARLGLVESRREGNRTYYRANPRHPLCADIRNLVLKTSGLVDVLRHVLDDHRIKVAFVFGSMAAGTDKATSDIDLMVIGAISLRDLVGLLSQAVVTLGREVNPHIQEPGEFARRRSEGDLFVATVLRGPKLFVIGTDHDLEALGR